MWRSNVAQASSLWGDRHLAWSLCRCDAAGETPTRLTAKVAVLRTFLPQKKE